MHLLRKVTTGAEKMAKTATSKSQKYTFQNMLEMQVRVLLEEDAEGMLQAAKQDLDTGIPVVGKRREEHARKIREQYKLIVDTTRPFTEFTVLPEQFRTVNMRSPMVLLTVGICLPDGVLSIVMVKQKLTPSELAFTINAGYLRTPSAKKVRADSLEEAVLSFGLPVGFLREALLEDVARSEESGALGRTPGATPRGGATPRPSVPEVQPQRQPPKPGMGADRVPSAADQEWEAFMQQAQPQRLPPKPGMGVDRAPSAADQEWEALMQQGSHRPARGPAWNPGRASSSADQEWEAMLQEAQSSRPAHTPTVAEMEWQAPCQAPCRTGQNEWDAFLQQELQKQRSSRMPEAETPQVMHTPCAALGSGTSTPSQPPRPRSAHTSFARQPPPWQHGVNMAETQARQAGTYAAQGHPSHGAGHPADPRQPRSLPARPAGSKEHPWASHSFPSEPPPLPPPARAPAQAAAAQAPPTGTWPCGTMPCEETEGWPGSSMRKDHAAGMTRPAAPAADAMPGGIVPRGFIPVEGQVEFFSQPLRRYVPALLVGLAVEATSAGPPGSLCVVPSGCAQLLFSIVKSRRSRFS
ncbi:unnamed protein product [Symbiodinium sp. CCMP2592]|nr:unnamed protein product [Symbiodinium sp. CCMP2592]